MSPCGPTRRSASSGRPVAVRAPTTSPGIVDATWRRLAGPGRRPPSTTAGAPTGSRRSAVRPRVAGYDAVDVVLTWSLTDLDDAHVRRASTLDELVAAAPTRRTASRMLLDALATGHPAAHPRPRRSASRYAAHRLGTRGSGRGRRRRLGHRRGHHPAGRRPLHRRRPRRARPVLPRGGRLPLRPGRRELGEPRRPPPPGQHRVAEGGHLRPAGEGPTQPPRPHHLRAARPRWPEPSRCEASTPSTARRCST